MYYYINNIEWSIIMLYYKLSVIFLTLMSINHALANVCYKTTYGRGVGTIPSECPKGQVKSGLLCYEMPPGKNANDYKVIAGVAWAKCKWGNDGGSFCTKPGEYGRGAGYALWDKDKCFRENSQGCEQNGAMYYPKCASSHHPVGCCICSPNCPPNTTDIGAMCNKDTFVMPPKPAICKLDQDMDAGLCYNKCSKHSSGVGPVCWGQCQAGMVDCGAMCASSAQECGQVIAKQIFSLANVAFNVAKVIKDPKSFLSDLGDAPNKFNEAKAKQEQMDELKAKTKEVRNAILDEFGIKIIKDEKEFKRLLKERLNQELEGKDIIGLDPKVIDQLIETASLPDDSNTKKLIDTIAEYDVSGLGIKEALEAFNLDVCPQ